MNYKQTIIVILVYFFFPAFVVWGAEYQPLVGIPGVGDASNFDQYIDALYALSISLAALIAVVKIILAGAKYMLSDQPGDKSSAKDDIRNALIGLLIVIGAVVILNTVNSDLTTLNVLNNATRAVVDDVNRNVVAMQAHCDDLEAIGADKRCQPVPCNNLTFWNKYEQIVTPTCTETEPSCEQKCSALRTTISYGTSDLILDGLERNRCDQVDTVILDAQMQEMANKIALRDYPRGNYKAMNCDTTDYGHNSCSADIPTITNFPTVFPLFIHWSIAFAHRLTGVENPTHREILDAACEFHCLTIREDYSTTTNVIKYDAASRVCIVSDWIPLTTEECNVWEGHTWFEPESRCVTIERWAELDPDTIETERARVWLTANSLTLSSTPSTSASITPERLTALAKNFFIGPTDIASALFIPINDFLGFASRGDQTGVQLALAQECSSGEIVYDWANLISDNGYDTIGFYCLK